MEKRYHVYEYDNVGRVVLWVKTLLERTAYDQLASLKKKFPTKKFYIEIV